MKENLLTLRKYATIESIYNHNNNNSSDPYSLVDDPWPPGGHCQHKPPPTPAPSSAVPPSLPPPLNHEDLHPVAKQPKLVKTLQHNYSKSKSTPSLKYFSDINDHLDMVDIRNEAPSRIENFSKMGGTVDAAAGGDSTTTRRHLVLAQQTAAAATMQPNNINEHYSTFPTQKLKNKNFTNSLKRIKNVFNNNNSNANRNNMSANLRSFNAVDPDYDGGDGEDKENVVKFNDNNCFYAKSYCEIVQLCKQFFSETDLTNMKKLSKKSTGCDYYDERDDEETLEYQPTKLAKQKTGSFTLPRCKSLPNISQVHDGKPKKFCSYGYKKIIQGYVKSKGFNDVTNYVDSKFGTIIDRALNENHIISTGSVTLPRAKTDKNWGRGPRSKKLDVNESIRRFLYEDAFKTFDYVKSDPARRVMCSSCGQWTEPPSSSALYERSDSEKLLAGANECGGATKPALRKYATMRYKKNPQQFNSLSWRNRTDYKKLNKLDRVCVRRLN